MGSNYTESEMEQAALEWFEEIGYEVATEAEVSPESDNPLREAYSDVVLMDRLLGALERNNPTLPAEAIEEAYRQITVPQHPGLIENNHAFHRMVTEGVDVPVRQDDGTFKTEKVVIFNQKNPESEDFLVVNQFTVKQGNAIKRPDIVVFVNGLPIAIFELKNPANEGVGIEEAYNQIQTYKESIPALFTHNELVVLGDVNARIGTLTSPFSRYSTWRTLDGDQLADNSVPQLEVLIKGVFDKSRLIDVIYNYILFQQNGNEVYKIFTAYHQFHAVHTAVEATVNATHGDHRIGVVWHTQGSGKSLTMVFYAARLMQEPRLKNPTIIVITDRNDLDNQLFSTFSSCKEHLRCIPVQTESRSQLRQFLNQRTSGGIIFTTIQKFAPDAGDTSMPVLTDRTNVIVMADEAHRSQYGFEANVKSKADGKMGYGFAKYLHESLPNASYIGFTGTPIDEVDKNTRVVFGDYIDVYDLNRAVVDGTTVQIFYESRVAQANIPDEILKTLDEEYDEITEGTENSIADAAKAKWTRVEAIVGSDEVLNVVANDFVEHFEARQKAQEYEGGKAMFVAMSRRIAVKFYDAVCKLRPDWHSDDIHKGKIKVVMTSSSSDPIEFQPHRTTKSDRDLLAQRMKDVNDELQIVIVRDMWLTGFDVPAMHTLYIDKPMKGHNLMQAIARVNRVFKDKEGGLVVDYIGIAENLKRAIAAYTQGQTRKKEVDTSEAVKIMLDSLNIIEEMLQGVDYDEFFTTEKASVRASVMCRVMDFVLGFPDEGKDGKVGKKDFCQTVAELAAAYSLCATMPEGMQHAAEVGFFKALRAQVIKFLNPNTKKPTKTRDELEHEINALVSRSIKSDRVIDLLGEGGMDRPNIGILDDAFLEGMKNVPQKNLSFELLKRLLNGEIQGYRAKNIIKAKKFSEMLENAIVKYHNHAVDTTRVIQELIDLAKKIKEDQKEREALGLSVEELAFYDALADNDSAKSLMDDVTLQQIAKELTQAIRENLTVDWAVRSSVQAKMRIVVKRLLKKYKYPPDQTPHAVEVVLEQTKLMCLNEGD